MAVTVKKAVLWRRELANRPGTLAETLKPFADGGLNLQVVMGYAYPGEPNRSAVEVYPVSGKGKAEAAAKAAGLSAADSVHCLIVEGGDKIGLAYQVSKSLSEAGINISFAVIQVVGGKYQGVFGFESAGGAERATAIIKSVAKSAPAKKKGAKKAAARKSTGKKASAKKKPAKKGAAKKGSTGAKKPAGRKAAKKPARKMTKKR